MSATRSEGIGGEDPGGGNPATAPSELRGDDTGARSLLVHLGDEGPTTYPDWDAVERTLAARGQFHVDPSGCRFVLAYGLVPPPYTLYRDVYRLGIGDRMRIDPADGTAEWSVDFPYREARSREDVAGTPDALKARLARAVEAALPRSGDAWLMQSSGKDSAGLLVGLAQVSGARVRSATYDAGYVEREAEPAAALARRFGIEHTVVPADPVAECRCFLDFAGRSPSLCADVALIPYLFTLETCGVDSGVVLDGLGNDAYMGYVVPARDAWLERVSLPRWLPSAWGRFESPDLGARVSYLWKSSLMYPAERAVAGSRLAPRVVRQLLPGPSPFDRYFADLDRALRGQSAIDRRAHVRGRIFDGCGTMTKARLAAQSRGARAAFPYCDRELIDYCFHLPRSERYDDGRRINKLALRALLEREIGDSPYLTSKGSFRVDVLRFVDANAKTIRDEIGAAARFFDRANDRCRFYEARRSNYVHAYALTTWFMLAAWLNRRPEAATGALLERGDFEPRLEPARAPALD